MHEQDNDTFSNKKSCKMRAWRYATATDFNTGMNLIF